jgi:hypothetical protein
MKVFCFLLLMANLSLYAYGRFDQWSETYVDPLHEAVAADRIRQLNPQQVAALGPSKVAQLNLSCIEWGPFNDSDKIKAQKALEPLQLGKTVSASKTDINLPYWVHIPAKNNKTSMEKALAEIKKMNIAEVDAINSGADQFAISFGHYRDEASAKIRLAEVEKKGVRTAKLSEKPFNATMNTLLIREPQQGSMPQLEQLKSQFNGSELKTSVCPERSA